MKIAFSLYLIKLQITVILGIMWQTSIMMEVKQKMIVNSTLCTIILSDIYRKERNSAKISEFNICFLMASNTMLEMHLHI